MADKVALDLTTLSETLLIPLWAKAVEQQQSAPLLRDPVAPQMLARLDYDFGKYAKATASQAGCCGRAWLFDEQARHFIAAHPDAVVVQIGAGLDARYERLGRPPITAWYDLDLPEVIALRRELLPETGNIYLGDSLFATDWMARAAAHGKPVLLLCEGVLMYFEENEVRAWLATLAQHLPQAELVFDIIPTILVGRAKRHDALGSMDKPPPEMKWSVKECRELENWLPGLQLAEEQLLSKTCSKRYPLFLRLLYALGAGSRLDQRIVRVKLP
ncbi:class I SAM-dependent methyltransferase [uncultured Cardiobacterium sp.]|uniref:class I SAM-dependent methyltransferase n=1 Tax=uncultured Cardiobacterium sp. TaxID=417619 RepID=UPI002606E08B|nr:class I SAM-dependent methyltransferase [uncultured Cardiobacterium sp.]